MFFNNGSTKEQAIIINAPNEKLGVDAEYDYLNLHYPEWELVEQTLCFSDDKPYDIMSIILPDGSKKDVWFDISNFYGSEDE